MKQPHGSKSNFVRNQPPETPAKEVVKLAKREGMKLSVAQVYNIRSTSKLKAKAGKVVAKLPGRRQGKTVEMQLRQLIGEIGLAKAREIMDEVAGRFAG